MHCKDIWKKHIPQRKLEIYKQMIDERLITDTHVTYCRDIGWTVVEYESDHTQEWIRQEMARRCFT